MSFDALCARIGIFEMKDIIAFIRTLQSCLVLHCETCSRIPVLLKIYVLYKFLPRYLRKILQRLFDILILLW